MSAPLRAAAAAERVVGALVAGGVPWVVFSPGSRSAPLVYAASRAPLGTLVRVDERAAAFTAVGIALAAGRPAVVVTTSGTATGNVLPAVMEASHAGVPLLVLTADRPARLQGTGANQTTDQVGLYGTHVRRAWSVPAGQDPTPAVGEALRWALGECGQPRGPVHVNLSFDEPLIPSARVTSMSTAASSGHGGLIAAQIAPQEGAGAVPFPAAGGDGLPTLGDISLPLRRTVVVAGHHGGAQAEWFARQLGLPLLAEPSSGARWGPNAMGPYQLLLPRYGEQVERVVVFGKPTLSRAVRALLARPEVPKALYVPGVLPWCDVRRRDETPVSDWWQLARFAGRGAPGWLAAWRWAASRVGRVIERELGAGLSGLSVARDVWAHTEGVLFLGSSNPIRDVDIAAVPRSDRPRVYANRGLSGIDGLVSTAAGLSVGAAEPVRALVGDVSLLHDAGGLLVPSLEGDVDVQLIVLNDSGGGIFCLLEHGRLPAQYAATVERFFGTPHTVDVAALAAAYGWGHRRVGSVDEFTAVLGERPVGRNILEVPVDRGGLAGLHGRLREAVAEELSGH